MDRGNEVNDLALKARVLGHPLWKTSVDKEDALEIRIARDTPAKLPKDVRLDFVKEPPQAMSRKRFGESWRSPTHSAYCSWYGRAQRGVGT